MSSSNENTIFKKTSFLTGVNSEFINEFYADYISDPKSLPKGWKNFFDGLSEDEKLVFDNLLFKPLKQALRFLFIWAVVVRIIFDWIFFKRR